MVRKGGHAVRELKSGIARRVVPEPRDEWSEEFLAALGAWKDDIERPRSIDIATHA